MILKNKKKFLKTLDEACICIFDKFIALLALCILSPIFVILWIILPFYLKSSALYRHERAGYMGKPFVLYKFRTMVDVRKPSGELASDEERMTRIGKWLREWSIDEIPQFINVLKGNLRLVGPRPLLLEYLPLYTKEQARRHEVPPGMTGWAQIHGRNAIQWEQKFEYDVWYVNNRSFLLNLKIIFLSITYVLRRQHIHHEGYNTMPKFTGSKLSDPLKNSKGQ